MCEVNIYAVLLSINLELISERTNNDQGRGKNYEKGRDIVSGIISIIRKEHMVVDNGDLSAKVLKLFVS